MDQNHRENTKRIAKNTVMLYGRTLVMLIVSLYTSRINLEALGIDNYGINNVVGGVVGMFSIISGSLSGAISRFLTYALGEGNMEKLKKTFSLSINIQIAIGLVIILIGEIAGVWFISHKLNIPPDRLYAAHWVYQCALISFFLGLISVPYNACLIAHEKMGVFAYMTIVDAALKLGVAFTILYSPFDKLITCAILNSMIALFMRIFYGWYCARHFEECHYKMRTYDKTLAKEMTGFAWWGFFGNTAWMFNTQGVNILINMFFGVVYNAARGVAGQVEGAVMGFVGNFSVALNPQITKSYASSDFEYLFSLICKGARMTFYLILLFMIPVWLQADALLGIWLVDVPPMAATFLRLSIFCTIATNFGNTAYTAIMATGKIRNYQIAVTTIGCLVFPFTWIAYKLGMQIQTTYYIFTLIYLILIWVRLVFLKKLMNFPISMFVKKAIFPSFLVVVSSAVLPTVVTLAIGQNWMGIIITTLVSILSLGSSIWLFGSTEGEKDMVKKFVINKINLYRNKQISL